MKNNFNKGLAIIVSIVGCIAFMTVCKSIYGVYIEMEKAQCLKKKLQSITANEVFPSEYNLALVTQNLSTLQNVMASFGRGLVPIQHQFSDTFRIKDEIDTISADIKCRAKLNGIKIQESFSLEFSQLILNKNNLMDDEKFLRRKVQGITNALDFLLLTNPKEILSVTHRHDDYPQESSAGEFYLINNLMYSTTFFLSFIGTTESLRTFLNSMHSFEVPIFLDDLKVQPSDLEDNLSLFTTKLRFYYLKT